MYTACNANKWYAHCFKMAEGIETGTHGRRIEYFDRFDGLRILKKISI